MGRLVGIGEASKALGVSVVTLRRWEAEGRIEAERSIGGQRRYDLDKLRPADDLDLDLAVEILDLISAMSDRLRARIAKRQAAMKALEPVSDVPEKPKKTRFSFKHGVVPVQS